MVPIRIVMADDHELFRYGFAAMLQHFPHIELVDQCINGQYLVAAVTKHQPDVVVTDIEMPGMGGLEATQLIHKRFPSIPVIALSMYDQSYTIIDMLKAGAVGYLIKNATKQVVAEAIESARKGQPYYCRTSYARISAMITSGHFDPTNPEIAQFTAIDLRIVRMMCTGAEPNDIAAKLDITLQSFHKYRKTIMQKADVTSVTALTLFAIRTGIYRLGEEV